MGWGVRGGMVGEKGVVGWGWSLGRKGGEEGKR